MRTSFVHWLYLGQALASRHPLFFQWVTRERDSKRKRTIFELKIWPGTHSLLSCPRMCILGELSRIYRGRLEYLHGSVGCCKWETLTSSTSFGLEPWQYHACCIMHRISCILYLKRKLFCRHGRCLRLKLNFIKGKLFHHVGNDGIFVVSPGELLHPGYDGFWTRPSRDLTEHPLRLVDGQERAITHCRREKFMDKSEKKR